MRGHEEGNGKEGRGKATKRGQERAGEGMRGKERTGGGRRGQKGTGGDKRG